MYALDADEADAEPRQIAATDMRCSGIAWGSGDLALVRRRGPASQPRLKSSAQGAPWVQTASLVNPQLPCF